MNTEGLSASSYKLPFILVKDGVVEVAKFLSLFELCSKEEQHSYFVEDDECCSFILKNDIRHILF